MAKRCLRSRDKRY